MGEVELAATFVGDRCAQHAAGIFQHEVHIFRCDFLCRDDEVAFVFTVFVIHHNYEFALTEIVDGLLYGVKFYFIVHLEIIFMLTRPYAKFHVGRR